VGDRHDSDYRAHGRLSRPNLRRWRREGRIGGGGTDKHLRHYLMEATLWAGQIPRYRATYERTTKRRGNKIGRIVVARLLLRNIYVSANFPCARVGWNTIVGQAPGAHVAP
jgi:hypothetical protein